MRQAVCIIVVVALGTFAAMAAFLPARALPMLIGAIVCIVFFGGLPVLFGRLAARRTTNAVRRAPLVVCEKRNESAYHGTADPDTRRTD